MSEKHQSHHIVQSEWNTLNDNQYRREISRNKPIWKTGNELLTYGMMLELLMVAYIQYVIMLIDFQKVLIQYLKCLCSKSTTVLPEWTILRTVNVNLLKFYCIKNKYIV